MQLYGDEWELGWYRELAVRPGLAEYDFDKSDLLAVPGDWNSQSDSLLLYEGTIWYKRSFDAAPIEGRRLFVHFGAATTRAAST